MAPASRRCRWFATPQVEEKVVEEVQEKQMELVNPLFATAGRAQRLAFAIDVSGSMLETTPFGMNRLELGEDPTSQ